jgi:tetratricopeptide (TPR) repeat protein
MDAFYMNNIGEISLEQGRLDEAASMFTDASRIWRAAGYRSGAASVQCLLGRVRCGEGRYAEAQELFRQSLEESQEVGGNVEVLDTKARIAECLLLEGDTEAALEASGEALEQSRALGGISAQHPLLFRIRGAAFMRCGDLDAAREALEESLRAALARDADYERALTLRVLARFDERAGTSSHPGAHPGAGAESAAILDRLGVVWTPELV